MQAAVPNRKPTPNYVINFDCDKATKEINNTTILYNEGYLCIPMLYIRFRFRIRIRIPSTTTTTNNKYDAAFPQRVANVMSPHYGLVQRVPLLLTRCSLLFISRYQFPVTRYSLLFVIYLSRIAFILFVALLLPAQLCNRLAISDQFKLFVSSSAFKAPKQFSILTSHAKT